MEESSIGYPNQKSSENEAPDYENLVLLGTISNSFLDSNNVFLDLVSRSGFLALFKRSEALPNLKNQAKPLEVCAKSRFSKNRKLYFLNNLSFILGGDFGLFL